MQPETEANTLPKRILVVDDEQLALHSHARILGAENYRVDTAVSGEKAIDKILYNFYNSTPFDLVITDIRMPGMSGVELIENLEILDMQVPKLVITGFGDKDLMTELIRSDCSDYLEKPFSQQDLLDSVTRIFEKQSARTLKNKLLEQEHFESPYLRQALEDCKKTHKALKRDFQEIASTYNQLLTLQSDITCLNCYFRCQKAGNFKQILLDYKITDRGCNLILAHTEKQNIPTCFSFLLVKAYFDAMSARGLSSLKFLDELNQALCKLSEKSQPISVLVLEYDKPNHSIKFCSAGFRGIAGFMNREGIETRNLKVGSTLGTGNHIKAECKNHPLNPGDKIFLVWENTHVSQETSNWFPSIMAEHFTMDIENLVHLAWRDLPIRRYNKNNDLLLLGLEEPTQ